MAAEKKKSRWNRFEIAFNEGKRPEAAACKKDWRNKWESAEKREKTAALSEREKPESAQEPFVSFTAAKPASEGSANAEAGSAQEPFGGFTAVKDLANAESAFAQEPFADRTAAKQAMAGEANAEPASARAPFAKLSTFKKKFSSGSVRNLEEARRVKIDAEEKKRVKLALKLKRVLESPPEESDFPFARRSRTHRMSDPPRRFDDRRRDREDGQN